MAQPKSAPAIFPTSPSAGGVVGGRAEIGAALPGNSFAEVTFLQRPVGTSAWTPIGTDDNAPYRVFHDVSGLAKGTLVEYRMVAKDLAGHVSATSTYGIVGEPTTAGGGGSGGGVGPVTQPANVSVPGSHNSEMGCSGDWQPDCAQAQLTLDPKDEIWKGTYTSIPAGDYEYKAAINKSWDENYGVGGGKGAGNIAYTAPAGKPVNFYYDHRTHWVTSDAQGPIITAPGSFQSELGCPGDWAPDCMRSWLQDPDGDGTYTFTTDQIPAGSYEFKVAVGLSWNECVPGEQRRLLGPVRRRADDHQLQGLHPRGLRQDVQGRGCPRPDQVQGLRRRSRPRRVARVRPARGDRPRDARLAPALVGRRWTRGRRRGGDGRFGRHPDPRPRRPAGLARGGPPRAQGLRRPAHRQGDGPADAADPPGPGRGGDVRLERVAPRRHGGPDGHRARRDVCRVGPHPHLRRQLLRLGSRRFLAVGADRPAGDPADLASGQRRPAGRHSCADRHDP